MYIYVTGGGIGDINGDGYVDWGLQLTFVSAPDSQIIHIFLGGPDADMNHDYVLDSRPLDSWVQSLGDFNGDGYDDIYHYETNPNDILDVYFGSADFDTFPDWIRYNPSNQNILPTVTGDFNGDGYGDFIAGPLISERGFYFGSPDPDTLPRQSWNVGSLGGTAADMNGDGKDDIITGLTSGAQVFFGGDVIANTADAMLNFPGCPDGDVQELSSAGDFNRDGYDDVVAISQTCNMGWGKMVLYLGSQWVNANPVFQIEGRNPPLNLVGIFSSEALGDVNGDGLDDFAVGAVNEDNDGRRGRVVIFSGDTTYIVPVGKVGPAIPDQLSLSVYPNPFNSTLSISLDVPLHRDVTLSLYDLLGREVDVVYRGRLLSSTISYVAPDALSSGVYFLRASAGSQAVLRKVVLLK